MLSDGIYTLLTTSSAVLAQIGTPAQRLARSNGADQSTGVFPLLAPEAAISPYVIFSQVSGADAESFDGANALNHARYEFSCYAQTYEASKQLARAGKTALLGLQQSFSDGTELSDAQLVSEQDLFEDAPFQYRTAVDLKMWFADVGS